jgi:16S rRNA (guanine966-N2)-methyltransferase
LRVVAGTFKGQRLQAPKRASTRPTADRVREALFSMLGPVEGERVLDLFAGSGALGIEALSRAATQVTFVDSDVAAVTSIRKNIDRLGIEEASIVRADAGRFLETAARRGEQWSLVFCDPPYRLAHRLGRDLEARLQPVLTPQARIVCESSQRQPLVLGFPLMTERRYGDTLICIYRCNGEPE